MPLNGNIDPQDRDLEQGTALVNSVSGLANDYLNLFAEIVMLIENLPTMPDLMPDILDWRPITYQDYFAKSTLPGRQTAIDAYSELDQKFRKQFEMIVAELDTKAVGSVAAIRRLLKNEADGQALAELCTKTSDNIRQTLTKATVIVNHGTRRVREGAQHRADRLMGNPLRRVG